MRGYDKMVKRFFAAAVAVITLLSFNVFAYASDKSGSGASDVQAAVYLDGVKIDMDAYISDGTVYLPLKPLGNALGYTVAWSEKNDEKVVTLTGKDKSIALDLKEQTVTNNGHTYYMYAARYTGNSFILRGESSYLESEFFAENFDVRVQYDADAKTVKVGRLSENPVSVTTMKLHSEDENLIVNLQYPQIGGLEDIKVQEGINSVFTHAASAAVEEGLQNSFGIIVAKQHYPDMKSKCETNLNYRITYNQNGLLSVVLYNYQYSGGAHGGTAQISYTFDLSTGKTLDLSALMKEDASYISYINSAIRTEIDKRTADGDLMELVTSKFETVGEKPDYYLNGDSVVFYFQQYEYFPYAAGIQEFPLKYRELEDMLKADYVSLLAEPEE